MTVKKATSRQLPLYYIFVLRD